MGKIALQLFGNTFHANHPSDTMAQMDKERYGLPVFRRYGVAATCYFQGVDLLMKPWLREEMFTPGSLEWGNAPFSHTLTPWTDDWRSELADRKVGTVPITFFPEFYIPSIDRIPTAFTLVLCGQSVLYSAFTDEGQLTDPRMEDYPDDAKSVRFRSSGGKTGILMRSEWFGPLLFAYFQFQRYPLPGSHPDGIDTLARLVAEVRKVAEAPDDHLVVCPLDMEAPWIGSRYGAAVWEILFSELAKQGLIDTFVRLGDKLSELADGAELASHPHRVLTKWSCWTQQLDYREQVRALRTRGERELRLKMLAAGSDIYAAWGIKFTEKMTGKQTTLGALAPDGRSVAIPIGFNQSVIDVQLAAFRAVRDGTTMAYELPSDDKDDYFVDLARKMAEREHF